MEQLILNVKDEVLEIVERKDLIRLSVNYRGKLQSNRTINVKEIFKEEGIPTYRYEKLIRLLGSVEQLKEVLITVHEVYATNLEKLLGNTVEEINSRLSTFTPPQLINLLDALKPAVSTNAAAQANVQVNFNLDDYLAKR